MLPVKCADQLRLLRWQTLLSKAAYIYADQMRIKEFAQGSNSLGFSVMGFKLTTFQAVIQSHNLKDVYLDWWVTE